VVVSAAGIIALSKSLLKSSEEKETTKSSSQLQDEFTNGTSLVKVGSPREVLSASRMTKNFIKQDNLFDKMMEVEMVKEIHCFYDPQKKEFHSIVHLGKEVCGYPNTVHGGLTAAIVDETFGGLMFNVWKSGMLGFSLPAVTARLEVDYVNRLPHDSVVLCTTRLEECERNGRSFWMQAELSDQSKETTYATARACFVSPSWSRSAMKWLKGITGF